MERYWLIYDGTWSVVGGAGSVWSGTDWYLVVLGHWVSITWYCLVLSKTGLVQGFYACTVYISKKVEIWSDITIAGRRTNDKQGKMELPSQWTMEG